MTVIKTEGGLILYSPVALTADHVQQIDNLGDVSIIIAPNLYHHMFVRECAAIYKDARVLIPQGLTEKVGPIPNAEIIERDTIVGADGDIDQFTFTGHRICETLLYHRRSRTLITADLLYHYTADQFFAERLWFKMIGCYGSPKIAFYHRFAITDKASVESLIQTVSSWQVERVMMCHGRILSDERAGEIFTDAWRRIAKLT